MLNYNLNVWGRDFELPVVFDCYKDETVLPEQELALTQFLAATDLLSSCLDKVKTYCEKQNPAQFEHAHIDNIFKYVIPQQIYVQRTNDKSRIVALMCAYKFFPENGLAIVFKNEMFEAIGSQDIVL